MASAPVPDDDKPVILLVDDDQALCDALGRSLAARGFDVRIALSGAEAERLIEQEPPEYAVIDLKLPDAYGLKLIATLKASDPHTRIVVLTGYGSVPSAVESIKLGANYYLSKPANVEDIIAGLHRDAGSDDVPAGDKPMSLNRLEWEHIQRVLHEHNGNISATARALSMHRRTLQRKIAKKPARD
jgi:two-component system response regulator RegA